MEKYKRYKDKERRKKYHRQYMRKYRLLMKERGITYYSKWTRKEYNISLREQVFEILGGAKCHNCGCENKIILEVNHKNGGGRMEHRVKNSFQFYRDIIKKRVNIDDYNILCRVCNAQHYVEIILGIRGHEICWMKPKS